MKDTIPTHFPEEVSKSADYNVILTHPEKNLSYKNMTQWKMKMMQKRISQSLISPLPNWPIQKVSGVIEEGIVTTLGKPAWRRRHAGT